MSVPRVFTVSVVAVFLRYDLTLWGDTYRTTESDPARIGEAVSAVVASALSDGGKVTSVSVVPFAKVSTD